MGRLGDRWRLLVAWMLLVGLAALRPPTAQAATITVTTCDQANLQTALTNAASGDTVSFGCSGTITLTSTLTLSKNVTIDGSGQAVTISGNQTVGVLVVNNGVSVTLQHLTIANGSTLAGGGGILNYGTLTLANSTVSGNLAGYGGGILNQGALTLTNSTLSGNTAGSDGGGIFDLGAEQMTITNSTVSGNTAGEGGGIFTEGTSKVTMTDSTVSGNSASVTGGGMLSNAPLTMTNSTVSENSARSYGGGIIAGGTLTLTNSTVSGNTASVGSGGGIYSSGALTLTNSTVSGNSAPAGGGIYNNGGTLTTANNIFANSTGGDCAGTDPADNGGNLADDGACHFSASSSANNVTTLNLGSLANNGGPTETIALLPDSAAIWHAVPTTCQAALPTGAGGVDQRGLPRGTTACDSGAYEFQPYPSTTTLTSSGNPSIVGQSVTFTVTVAATASAHMGVQNAAPIVPTGPVSFSDGSTVLCNAVALVDGIASCMTSALTVGVHTITAAYSGDGTFAASSGMLTQTVNTAAPPAPTASVVGQVTGDGGAAVAHAMVKATYAGGGFAYDTTDGAGHYDIRNLTPGNYVITLVAPSGLTVTSANDIPEAMAGTSEVTINFTLSATAPAGTTTTGMTSATSGSFQPFWVQVFASDAQLYSGQDSNAVAFGPVAQWTYLLVVEPQTSSRLAVYNPVTHNYAYVNADQVGPSGPPRS